MNAAKVLHRLEGVRQTQPDKWIARCPAHKDRSPSLSIRDAGNDLILLHCHAGCHFEDVVAAMGLKVSDLMPPKPITYTAIPSKPPRLRADEALYMLRSEIGVITMTLPKLVTQLRDGVQPSLEDLERLTLATQRFAKINSFVDAIAMPELQAVRRGGSVA